MALSIIEKVVFQLLRLTSNLCINLHIMLTGVHGSRYVTTHGVGVNCNTDLSWFDHIVPCGIEGKGVTSLSRELSKDVSIKDAEAPLLRAFADVFHCDML